MVHNGAPSGPKRASLTAPGERLDFARGVVFRVVCAYWKEVETAAGRRWSLRKLPPEIEPAAVPPDTRNVAQSIGKAAARLNVMEASYIIGVLYTTMIPAKERAALGAYYTPPALCERLLDMATEAGVDWRSVRVLDPARPRRCRGQGRLCAERQGRHHRAPAPASMPVRPGHRRAHQAPAARRLPLRHSQGAITSPRQSRAGGFASRGLRGCRRRRLARIRRASRPSSRRRGHRVARPRRRRAGPPRAARPARRFPRGRRGAPGPGAAHCVRPAGAARRTPPPRSRPGPPSSSRGSLSDSQVVLFQADSSTHRKARGFQYR